MKRVAQPVVNNTLQRPEVGKGTCGARVFSDRSEPSSGRFGRTQARSKSDPVDGRARRTEPSASKYQSSGNSSSPLINDDVLAASRLARQISLKITGPAARSESRSLCNRLGKPPRMHEFRS